ncbi:hypothetical protein GCM10011609_66620 [Lentzea pudingi]|uniref:Alpha/beta hydrolase family protein n=1 Tax=Lentzea pudingi TaxID=1789439 RepID=A0ABQ2IKX5_9PSEU|nr:hypothetical protein [Lentzea pudingi]GGN16461.1 hypothetical protein GCM10011609_66620 [Lentzea pudingi]
MLVPVAGGDLFVEVHDGDTAPVLAIHGVSGSRKLWNWVAAHNFRLVAPDLRGRAYTVEQAAGFRAALPVLRKPVLINEVDHGGTVMTRAGAAEVAEVLAEAAKA